MTNLPLSPGAFNVNPRSMESPLQMEQGQGEGHFDLQSTSLSSQDSLQGGALHGEWQMIGHWGLGG